MAPHTRARLCCGGRRPGPALPERAVVPPAHRTHTHTHSRRPSHFLSSCARPHAIGHLQELHAALPPRLQNQVPWFLLDGTAPGAVDDSVPGPGGGGGGGGTWCGTQPTPALLPATAPGDPAMLVFSSGTTGEPKGMVLSHQGFVNSILARFKLHPYGDPTLVAAGMYFVWDVWRSLLGGVPMLIVPEDVLFDPQELVGLVRDNGVTDMLLSASLVEQILALPKSTLRPTLGSLRRVMLSGEMVTTTMCAALVDVLPTACEVLNYYSVAS